MRILMIGLGKMDQELLSAKYLELQTDFPLESISAEEFSRLISLQLKSEGQDHCEIFFRLLITIVCTLSLIESMIYF